MVQRYVTLKRKQALESDPRTIYCPRKWCQGPARSKKTDALDRNLDLESDEEDEPQASKNGPHDPALLYIPPSERLAICTECTFAFCRVCKASWHGELIICDPRRKAELNAEDKATEEYVKLHTSPCPTCNVRCQKTMGCNHMICFKCNSHFCYLCSSWLDAGNPYDHFNNPKKPCHMRLWELEAGDGDNVGIGFRGNGLDDEPDDGQDDNFLDDLDDVDADEAELLPAPIVPPAPHPRNQPVRPLPANVQAAIARRAAIRDAQNDAIAAPLAPERNGPVNAAPPGRQHPPGPVVADRAQGLLRLLDLLRSDEEDEWDSDELWDDSGDEDDYWEIPVR